MADGSGNASQRPATVKRCFVVSEFGTTEAERLERTQVLKHLVRKVLAPKGYEVKRADDIDDPGQITHQIIERLLDDDLVVADLTGRNPNVFYELAVRHAAQKPVITLMTHGEDLPFDLKDVRTVFYDLHDPDKLETAQKELGQKVDAIEASTEPIRNPITVTRDVALLRDSDDPGDQAAGAVLSAVNDLRDEMRLLLHTQRRTRSAADEARQKLSQLFLDGGNHSFDEIASSVEAPPNWLKRQLDQMIENKEIYEVGGGYSTIPF